METKIVDGITYGCTTTMIVHPNGFVERVQEDATMARFIEECVERENAKLAAQAAQRARDDAAARRRRERREERKAKERARRLA